ncbi:MAG: endoflagellar protein [Firmicutes bacterium HGW-Firmicutes-7]|nr:MAG: endoflagellar protein [Firmicutes bacterium HGW-Firmicutes-7]
MIFVTKMNNETILLNNDLIETIEETPDTVVTLTTGKKLIIKESSKEVLKRVIDFKMKIYNGDYDYGK